MKKMDNGWWRSDDGYIRQVLVTDDRGGNRDMFVSWRHMCPAIGYFHNWQQAHDAMLSQSPTASWSQSATNPVDA